MRPTIHGQKGARRQRTSALQRVCRRACRRGATLHGAQHAATRPRTFVMASNAPNLLAANAMASLVRCDVWKASRVGAGHDGSARTRVRGVGRAMFMGTPAHSCHTSSIIRTTVAPSYLLQESRKAGKRRTLLQEGRGWAVGMCVPHHTHTHTRWGVVVWWVKLTKSRRTPQMCCPAVRSAYVVRGAQCIRGAWCVVCGAVRCGAWCVVDG